MGLVFLLKKGIVKMGKKNKMNREGNQFLDENSPEWSGSIPSNLTSKMDRVSILILA